MSLLKELHNHQFETHEFTNKSVKFDFKAAFNQLSAT